jgi:hypothetical protein
MLAEPPLAWYRDWFNVRVAFLESPESGVELGPSDSLETALAVRKDGRLLHVGDEQRLAEVVRTAGDADIVLVLVNGPGCNGTGSRLIPSFRSVSPRAAPVVSAGCSGSGMALHEIGHSFADLADEYEDAEEATRFARQRLFRSAASNVTWDVGGPESSPWRHFLELPGASLLPWMHEGAYYSSQGYFRPWPFCRMRESHHPFCPVCSEALARAIHAACALPFNDDSYHAAHPLEGWRR